MVSISPHSKYHWVFEELQNETYELFITNDILLEYDVHEHFKYCFGIICPNNQAPQEVVLSFLPVEGKYIKSLPLHESQQALIDNEEELRIKLIVFITHDFIMELLSHGERVKVLHPESLKRRLKSAYEKALNRYEN